MKRNNIETLAIVGGLFFCILSAVAEPASNLTFNNNVISLATLDTPFLPAYGCVNDASAKCLDFGTENDDSVPGIHFNPDANDMGPRQNDEEGTTFRELLKACVDAAGNFRKCAAIIKFDKFNVDAAGNLLSPVLLEVRFKDTIKNPPVKSPVVVSSKIWTNYPDNNLKEFYVPILGLISRNGENPWQYAQYGFEKNAFQFLKVLWDDNFWLYITNESMLSSLPIDYIALRAISEDDYQALVSQGRRYGNFVQINPPKNKPSPLISYNNSALTVFSRDPMRPIYPKTKPAAKEINRPLHAISAPGELEPFQLGLYSQTGIDGLTVAISDLTIAGIGASIPSSASAIYKVGYAEKRLTVGPQAFWRPETKYYGLQPDHLEEFDQLSIPFDSSQAIWLKLRVPDQTPPGLYQGRITILRAGVVQATAPLKLEVLPLRLDPPKTRTSAFHDPYYYRLYYEVFSSDRSIFELFRDLGFDPFIYSGSLDFETRLKKFIEERIIKQNPIYMDVSSLYSSIKISDPDLYYKLSDPGFKEAFIQGIDSIEAIGKEHGVTFAFSVADEPCFLPDRRILADRLYTYLKEHNSLTVATYYPHESCQKEKEISSQDFNTPAGKIPPLTDLIDYKLWDLSTGQKAGYEAHLKEKENGIEPSKPYGYYTTNAAYLRNPIYNRFLHGLFAFGVDAESVATYALGDWVNNPYDDFDINPSRDVYNYYPDFIFAYPTWDGKMLMVMGAEGIREGIKDSKYLATLQRLIEARKGTAVAQHASEYLNKLKGRIKTDFFTYAMMDYDTTTGYCSKFGEYGCYEAILKDISESGNDHDFEAFTSFRETAADYIKKLATQGPPQ